MPKGVAYTYTQGLHHAYAAATTLASHPCPYRFQNLPPHASSLFSLEVGTSPLYIASVVCPVSNSRGLRSSTGGDFTALRTNLKFDGRATLSQDLENGTVFQFQFVDAQLLLDLIEIKNPSIHIVL